VLLVASQVAYKNSATAGEQKEISAAEFRLSFDGMPQGRSKFFQWWDNSYCCQYQAGVWVSMIGGQRMELITITTAPGTYLRSKTKMADALAWFGFLKGKNPELSDRSGHGAFEYWRFSNGSSRCMAIRSHFGDDEAGDGGRSVGNTGLYGYYCASADYEAGDILDQINIKAK
jgi:hypothetical protein